MRKTLQSIAEQQNVDYAYEVIVVDNGSTDDTKVACETYKKLITNLVYNYDDEPGQLTGRHKGTMLSKGNIVSFLDDDVELNPDWVNNVITCFQNDPHVSIVGGPSLPKYHAYPPSWTQYFWEPTRYGGKMCLPLSLIDIGVSQIDIDPVYVFGLNYSIRKPVLIQLDGFHPDCIPQHLQQFQGDGETGLSLKAREQNIKAKYIGSAFLYHQVPVERLTPGYFEKWSYYNGVCQSFTDLRLEHKRALTDMTAGKHHGINFFNRAGNLMKRTLKKSSKGVPDDIAAMQLRCGNKYSEGYRFHQQMFDTNISVKKWVLKENYWDYKLPA